MASWLTFSQPVDVDIRLEGEQDRKTVEVKMDKDRKENCPIYFDGEGVVGQVSNLPSPSRESDPRSWSGRRERSEKEGRRGGDEGVGARTSTSHRRVALLYTLQHLVPPISVFRFAAIDSPLLLSPWNLGLTLSSLRPSSAAAAGHRPSSRWKEACS